MLHSSSGLDLKAQLRIEVYDTNQSILDDQTMNKPGLGQKRWLNITVNGLF